MGPRSERKRIRLDIRLTGKAYPVFLLSTLLWVGFGRAFAQDVENAVLAPLAPDTGWAQPFVVDDFEYDDSPLDEGWGVFGVDSGAVVTTQYDSVLQSRVMSCQTTGGGGFGIYFPKGVRIGSNFINVWRRYLYFNLKTTRTTFNLILYINRQNCAGNFIVYRLTNGSPYVAKDSIIIPLGAGLADGRWHEVMRDLSADLHKGFSGEAMETRFLALRGDFFLDSLTLRNRPMIEGYANCTAAKQGSPVEFKASVNRPGPHTFHLEFYREGAEREFQFATEEIPGSEQPVPPLAYREGAGWPTLFELPAGLTQNWKSGMYVAKLVSDLNDSSFIPFVILEEEPGSTSDILFQFSTATYQAYNFWGGGSFYAGKDTVVSWDRPYSELWYGSWADGTGAGQFYAFELPLVRWVEGRGYPVEYADNVSVNDTAFDIRPYRLFLSVGHDEYWYENARNRLEYTFRDTLHNNLAFLSANSCFWRVREPKPNPKRKMITQKNCCNLPYFDQWRGLVTNGVAAPRPEASLIGVMYAGPNVRGRPAAVVNGSHWIFRGTGLATGDLFGFGEKYLEGISGYERDLAFPSSPANLEILAAAKAEDQCGGDTLNSAQTAYYQTAAGSEVFAAGGIQWSWGLADGDGKTARITKNVIDALASTVRGRISKDTVWEGTVYLGGDVAVDSGATLTIRPGSNILFFPGNDVEGNGADSSRSEIVVRGTLVAQGRPAGESAPDSSIVFSSAASAPQNGDWGGLSVFRSGRIELGFCRIQYADRALALLDTGSRATVRNTTFAHFRLRAFYTKTPWADLGRMDCGRNNILMKTASPGARALEYSPSRPQPGSSAPDSAMPVKDSLAANSANPYFKLPVSGDGGPFHGFFPLVAQGNWWDSIPPPPAWFLGNIVFGPYLSGPAAPDSCPAAGPLPAGLAAKNPSGFELRQNAPNPFNASTRIGFSLPAGGYVTLGIYNILGQRVKFLLDGWQPPGEYSVVWDATDSRGMPVSSGTYICRLQSRTRSASRLMLLLK